MRISNLTSSKIFS